MRLSISRASFLKIVLVGFAYFNLLVCSSTLADQRCITIDWSVSPDANVGSRQAGPHLSFINVNRFPIYFDFVPGSSVIYNGKEIQTVSNGCFVSENLFVGNNDFEIGFVYSNYRGPIRGRASTTFTLEKGRPHQRILCQAVLTDGSPSAYGCRTSIHMPLVEIDPTAASLVDQIIADEKRLRSEVRRLEQDHPSTEELMAILDEIANQDFDSISGEHLLAISKDLARVAQVVDNMKADLESLRQKFKVELQSQRTRVEEIHDLAAQELRNRGIQPEDQKLYVQFDVESLALPTIELPVLAAEEEKFDPDHNVYVDLADKSLRRLNDALQKGDLIEFNVIVEVWSGTVQALSKSLQNRAETAKVKELEVSNATFVRVKDFINQQVDSFGFLKKLQIPTDVKETIREDIAPVAPEQAARLRDVMNSWQGDERTAEQKLVLNTLRGIGDGFKVLSQLTGEVSDAEVEDTRKNLVTILDDAIETAKTVARIGVSFSPIGRFVDFCEVITGKEFCVPSGRDLSVGERSLSAVGTLIGSGEFWRKLGSIAAGPNILSIGKSTGRIVDSTSKLNIRATGDARKVIKSIKNAGLTSEKEIENLVAGVSVSQAFRKVIIESPKGSISFYVRKSGEAIPAKGFRYIGSNAKYLETLKRTGKIPANRTGTYISFNKFESMEEAASRLQVPHDSRYMAEIEMLPHVENVKIPQGEWGKANYLEPLTKDFPEFGVGGATQAIITEEIKVNKIIDLMTGEIVLIN